MGPGFGGSRGGAEVGPLFDGLIVAWAEVGAGRMGEALEQWVGNLPIWLHAEHGFWSRPPGQAVP